METESEVQVSDLKKKLYLKTVELDNALATISDLTVRLKRSASSLQIAQDALAVSDTASAVRDTELKTSEDALFASDVALQMKSTELKSAVENLIMANEELRHSRDLQNAFIRIAAHELKNPIQPLTGMAEILESVKDSVVGTDKIQVSKADIELIVRNAKRLERLANDILDVSRIESKSMRLNRETFDLNREIRDVMRDFQMHGHKSSEVNISFKPSVTPGGIIMVHADKSRIYEVISNILLNAIKFTASGTISIISAIGKDGAAIVQIKDTGAGISAELLSNLFTKFGVVGDASDPRSGSGLGLFISKGIIDAHGGKLWAQNNTDGKGSTFTFTIPAS